MKKGFSLPLWVAASAKAAVKKLLNLPFDNYEFIKIPNKIKTEKIAVSSAALIQGGDFALATTFVNSGLDLDLTNNLEIWSLVSFSKINDKDKNDLIEIIAGNGVGVDKKTLKICISSFAREVLEINLFEIIPKNLKLRLEIIFPNGEFLAERTSNKSFGIVRGLSVIGTTAETHSSASPDQLKEAKKELDKAILNDPKEIITFVIGENGLDIAKTMQISSPVIKVGNWIGPLMVHAAIKEVGKIILLGYHGKLIKLAGGVFHTHNHLADARIEILVYLAVKEKLPIQIINSFINSRTIDEAIKIIEQSDKEIATKLLNRISNEVEMRSKEYIQKYTVNDIEVGAILFNRERKICSMGENSKIMFSKTFTFKT